MTFHRTRWLLPCAWAATAFAAAAQTPPSQTPTAAPSKADPLDARAVVPAIVYRSSIGSGRRVTPNSDAVPWREANDTVHRIGGWRAYAREAQQPASAPGAHGHSHPKKP